MVAIPYSIADICADWLRAAVRPQDAPAFANLTSVRAERLGEGVGTSTDIHRLVLGYGPEGPRGPAALVVKMPSSSPAAREVARGWSSYQREVLFYRQIAETVRLRIPAAYVAEFDPQTLLFVLVMEDLSYAEDGNQTVGLSLERVRLALGEIATLHATWWNRPELVALEAIIQPFGEGAWVGTGARHAAASPAFDRFLAGRVSAETRQVTERLAAVIEPMMREMASGSRTICHGDFRADNMMFATGAGGTSLITIDWQAPMQARGAFDVAQTMSMSITTELRRAHETVLLRCYHDRLVAGGVEGYDYDEFFYDYRRSLLIGFTYATQAGPAVDMTHARALELFDSAVRRFDACVQDHGLGEFVD